MHASDTTCRQRLGIVRGRYPEPPAEIAEAILVERLIAEEYHGVFVKRVAYFGKGVIVEVHDVHIENLRTDSSGDRLDTNFPVATQIEHHKLPTK